VPCPAVGHCALGDLEFEVSWITETPSKPTWEPVSTLVGNEHFKAYTEQHGLAARVRRHWHWQPEVIGERARMIARRAEQTTGTGIGSASSEPEGEGGM
jgi:hypothetical protein